MIRPATSPRNVAIERIVVRAMAVGVIVAEPAQLVVGDLRDPLARREPERRAPQAGHGVDILQSAAKCAARRGTRVGKVDNLDTKRRKVALELVALFGALPVVSLEQYVEAKIPPDFDLIVR